MLSQRFYSTNRMRLLEQLPDGVHALIVGNGLMQRNHDTEFLFRQDSNMLYASGLEEPDLLLYVSPNEHVALLPYESEHTQVWTGNKDDASIINSSGVNRVLRAQEARKWLRSMVKRQQSLAMLMPEKNSYYQVTHNQARAQWVHQIKRWNSALEMHDLAAVFTRLRRIKNQEEILAIERAISITGQAIDDAIDLLSTMRHEYEFEAELTRSIRKSGAQGHAYAPIVASAGNAAVIHYTQNNDSIKKESLMLIDVGAEVSGYAADISRTFPVGVPTSRQKQLLKAVIDVQQQVIAQVRPGVLPKELEMFTEKALGVILSEHGIIAETERAQIRKFYPHGVSHSLGLDVHDPNDYSMPLEENMVITIEPGLYIPEEATGIRVEDDILVTAKGSRNLSNSIKTHYI